MPEEHPSPAHRYQTELSQLSLKQPMGQKPLNEGRQMASKIKIVKIGQYTVFPRGVVGFFQVKESGKNVLLLGKSISNETVKSYQLICSATFFSENRTAPRPINLWIPRPTSIACSSSSPSFCISSWLRLWVYSC